jgi:Protein of unknown function (DUF5132)
MALFDEERKGYVIGAIAALAAAAIVREFRSGFSDLGRPIAKATIKSGISLMDRGRELFAHLGEVMEDLAIEARLELDEKRSSPGAPQAEPTAERALNREVH